MHDEDSLHRASNELRSYKRGPSVSPHFFTRNHNADPWTCNEFCNIPDLGPRELGKPFESTISVRATGVFIRPTTRREFLGWLTSALAAKEGGEAKASIRPCSNFRRGINFHHVLNWPKLEPSSEPPRYAWPPFTDSQYRLTAEDLALVKSLGFTFIRLTVDPGLWIDQADKHAAELEELYLARIRIILDSGLDLVFDMACVENHPDYTASRVLSAGSPRSLDRYAQITSRAARLLSGLPADRVALELFNEPPLTGEAGEARWAEWQIRLHALARNSAPDLCLILTAAQWGDAAALTRLDVSPYADSNVMYTFHYYHPHVFTHQGMKSGAEAYISGLLWPIGPVEAAKREAYLAAEADQTLDSDAREHLELKIDAALAQATSRAQNEAAVAYEFAQLAAWANAHKIPPERILLGEFGCVLSSHGRPVGPSRLAWLQTVRKATEAHGFGWAYWAFKGYGGMEMIDSDGRLHADLVSTLGLNATRQ